MNGLYTSGEFFSVLGISPVAGRLFNAEDDRRGCGLPGAVISYNFWQQGFGGKQALGQKLTLNDKPVEIIGITPANFSEWRLAAPSISLSPFARNLTLRLPTV